MVMKWKSAIYVKASELCGPEEPSKHQPEVTPEAIRPSVITEGLARYGPSRNIVLIG